MRNVSILFFILFASLVHAQKPSQKPAQQPAQSNPQPAKPDQLDPQVIRHFVNKSELANRWNDTDVTRDALYDLIIEYPGNDSLIFALAAYYYDNQKYVSAVLVGQDLLVRTPKDPNLLQLLASGFEALSIRDKALANYESLYLINSNTGVLYKMAILQYELNKFGESKTNVDILLTKGDIETIKVALTDTENKRKEYPLKASILNLKGLLAQQANDKVEAKKAWDEALAVAPGFPLAKQNIAKLK
jgi:tetratricopeptide (TPR) repeat protein